MEHIVLFDGVCSLCSFSVQFIIKRDKARRFRFASLQSEVGQELAAKHGIDAKALKSIVLIDGETVYQRSTAALRILRHLDGAWKGFYVFRIIPTFIRDPVYNWISRNRYRWFGQHAECWIPTPELRDRFLA